MPEVWTLLLLLLSYSTTTTTNYRLILFFEFVGILGRSTSRLLQLLGFRVATDAWITHGAPAKVVDVLTFVVCS